MWIQILILILVLALYSFYVKEPFQEGDYRADMFSSNECPCLKCADKSKF